MSSENKDWATVGIPEMELVRLEAENARLREQIETHLLTLSEMRDRVRILREACSVGIYTHDSCQCVNCVAATQVMRQALAETEDSNGDS